MRRRAVRWLVRGTLALLALVVLAVGGVLIALHTDWGREQLRRRAEAIAGETLPGLRIGRIDGSVLGDLELHDVSLAAVEGGAFARARRVRLNLGLLALLGKTARLETLEVDGLELTLPRTPARVVDDAPATWAVDVPALAVHDARVVIEGDEPITLDGMTVTGSLASPAAGPLRVAAHATATWRERGLPIDATLAASVAELVEIPSATITAGDVRVVAANVLVNGVRTTGTAKITATPLAIAAFAPTVRLPGPLALEVEVTRDGSGPEERVTLAGAIGGAAVHGTLWGDPEARTAHGVIVAAAPDAGVFRGELAGPAHATLAVVVDPTRVRGTVIARAAALDLAPVHAIVGVDATRTGGSAVVIAAGDGDARLAAVAQLARTASSYELVDGHAVASVRDTAAATVGRVPVSGSLRVVGRARGMLHPARNLRVTGTVAGDRVAYDDLRVTRVRGTLGGTVRDALDGWAHATAVGIRRAGAPLGDLRVDARTRDARTLVVDVQAKPAAAAVVASARATVALPAAPLQPTTITLGGHRVHAATGQTWTGDGGRIVIGDDRITFAELRTQSGDARLAVDGSYTPASRTLRFAADARAFALSTIDPTLRGTIDGTARVQRRGTRWDGTAQVTATGVVVDPALPTIDGDLGVEVEGRRIRLEANVAGRQVGRVIGRGRVVLDLDGPRDLADGRAWARLDRAAIRAALVGVTAVELAAAGVEQGGVVDGELVLAGPKTTGTFTLRALQSPLGQVDGEITVAPMEQGELSASSTVRIAGIGDADVAALIVFPARPFDPAEWQRLGRGVIRVLTASVEDVAFDPAKLAKLGVDAPLRGRADLSVALAAGLGEAKATIDLRAVRGGPVAQPLDLHVEASIGAAATTASARVRRAATAPWEDGSPHLAKLAGSLPVPLARWIARPRAALDATLTGAIEVPRAPLAELLAIAGRTDVERGTLGGTITLGGTPRAITASGALVARDVQVKPRLVGRKVPTLTELEVGGSWRDGVASVQLVGVETGGAKLAITLHGKPAQLETVTGKIAATRFDIAPIAVFLPGPLVAATGTLDANLTITGLDLDGTIRGRLALAKGRVPLTPTIGTLRDANLTATVDARGFTGKLTGKIGRGAIEANATGDAALRTFQLTGKVRDLTPIGEIEPQITADVTGTLRREPDRLTADLRVRNGTVIVTPRDGAELLESELPPDLKVGPNRPGLAEPDDEPRIARTQRKPWFVATVRLDTTRLDAEREYVRARGEFRAPRLVVAIADAITIDGSVEIERGEVDVVGRQYRVEPGPDKLRFDSSKIPTLAIRITHEFPTMTLFADVGGTPVAPTLTLSSVPGTYSEEELFAFLLGASPSGERTAATRDVATGVGSAIASAKLGRRIKKALPFRIDVLQCEAASSASGASCTVGRWITQNFFVAAKYREQRRPDDLPYELQTQFFFWKRWMLEGSGWGSRIGGDLFWRKRW